MNAAFNQALDQFAAFDAQVVGISVDSIPSHQAVQRYEGELNYPMCADFWPHGGVAQKFGVFREGDPIPGISDRAVFIIGKDGRIAFAKVYHLGESPDIEELLSALKASVARASSTHS